MYLSEFISFPFWTTNGPQIHVRSMALLTLASGHIFLRICPSTNWLLGTPSCSRQATKTRVPNLSETLLWVLSVFQNGRRLVSGRPTGMDLMMPRYSSRVSMAQVCSQTPPVISDAKSFATVYGLMATSYSCFSPYHATLSGLHR